MLLQKVVYLVSNAVDRTLLFLPLWKWNVFQLQLTLDAGKYYCSTKPFQSFYSLKRLSLASDLLKKHGLLFPYQL